MNPQIRSMNMNIIRRAAVSPNRRAVTIAANDRARSTPELDLSGLRFDNYRRNPVVMWAHDAVGRSPSGGLPIGRTLAISRAPDGGIVAEFEFLDDDPFAQRIRNAWDKGFLQAASISWLPLESRPAPNGGLRDIRSELLEWSIVSVPADPDALRESHRRMLNSLLTDHAPADADAPTQSLLDGNALDTPTQSTPAAGLADMPQSPHAANTLAISPSAYHGLTAALASLTRAVEGIAIPEFASYVDGSPHTAAAAASTHTSHAAASPLHTAAAAEGASPPHTAAADAPSHAHAAALASLRALAADTRRLAAGDAHRRQRSPPTP